MSASIIQCIRTVRTSVSSVCCNSPALVGEVALDERPQKEDCVVPDGCAFWRPAFSRSWSFHERIEASKESISKRLLSALGVDRKDRRTLLTKRLSTLFSVELRRSRRRASIRCSFRITANGCQKDVHWLEEGRGFTFVAQFIY